MSYKSLSIIRNFPEFIFSNRFNKIDKLFSKLTGDTPLHIFPVYNIKKIGNKIKLTISLPGWKEKELEINITKGQLNIKGNKIKKKNITQNLEWIHKGINKKNFNISYTIPKHIKVQKAKLKNGLLSITLEQKIIKHEKPKKININKE